LFAGILLSDIGLAASSFIRGFELRYHFAASVFSKPQGGDATIELNQYAYNFIKYSSLKTEEIWWGPILIPSRGYLPSRPQVNS
jgi:hypothetical protein